MVSIKLVCVGGRQDPEAKDITTAVHGALQGSVLLDAFPKAIVDVQILIIEGQGGMSNRHVFVHSPSQSIYDAQRPISACK